MRDLLERLRIRVRLRRAYVQGYLDAAEGKPRPTGRTAEDRARLRGWLRLKRALALAISSIPEGDPQGGGDPSDPPTGGSQPPPESPP